VLWAALTLSITCNLLLWFEQWHAAGVRGPKLPATLPAVITPSTAPDTKARTIFDTSLDPLVDLAARVVQVKATSQRVLQLHMGMIGVNTGCVRSSPSANHVTSTHLE